MALNSMDLIEFNGSANSSATTVVRHVEIRAQKFPVSKELKYLALYRNI
jgi:hypothetical protein